MSAAEQVVTNDVRAKHLTEVAKLALYLSDIDFLRWMDREYPLSVMAPEAKELIAAQLPYYAFTESEDAYRAHYAKYEAKFFAGPVRQFVENDWTQDPRYQAILHAIKLAQPDRVLDFGCSTGHITRELAKALPKTTFVGCDLVPQAVSWFNTLAPENASADTNLPTYSPGFDIIICAEVLEHVIDPYQTLDLLGLYLNTGGQFLCTLPFGPWESRGWDPEDPYAREHVRHWGAAEILEVFGPDTLAWHIGAPDLGHTITLSGPRVGTVDMKSKLARYERLVGN